MRKMLALIPLVIITLTCLGCGHALVDKEKDHVSKKPLAPPSEQEIREACLQSLENLEALVEDWIEQFPDEMRHLQEPVLDREKLSLHFPDQRYELLSTDTSNRALITSMKALPDIQDRRPFPSGIFFHFHMNAFKVDDAKSNAGQWALIDVRLTHNHRAGWPREIALSGPDSRWGKGILACFEPLFQLEERAIRVAFEKAGQRSLVYRGDPRVSLSVKLEENRPKDMIEGYVPVSIWLTNHNEQEIKVPVGIAAQRTVQFAVDGEVSRHLYRILQTFQTGPTNMSFKSVAPGQSVKLFGWGIEPDAGKPTRVRFIWSHPYVGYTEYRQNTWHPPVPIERYIKVENAWTGIIISNELVIQPSP